MELETSTAVNVALHELPKSTLKKDSTFNLTKEQIDFKKSDYNEYSDSNLSVEIRSTCSTEYNYRKRLVSGFFE